ncbi:DUF3307 domain-containing protein [Clostridium ihumii]|uniref:DUF3307 domain-containing protein n=1 Tax=Clostridium ihumii TaxID=1470356 RepID=UPI003D332EF6
MYFSVLLIFLISHCIFDFTLQNEYIINLRFPKDNNKISILKGNTIHSILHCLGMFLLLWIFSLLSKMSIGNYYISILLISIFHFIIDLLKSLFIIKYSWLKSSVIIFVLDQILHIIVIVMFCPNITFKNIINSKSMLNCNNKVLLSILIVLICTSFTGIFIKMFISSLNTKRYKFLYKNNIYIPNTNNNNGAEHGGFIIGILERIFIIIIIFIDQPSLIGFVLATKSIARFKKLENESFAEYFIIGTFISFITALIGGLIIRKLFFHNN